MPQVSVIVLTYNPDNRKLRQTLHAIAAQKDVETELIISDDGSAQKDFSFLDAYLSSLGVTQYRLLAHEENRGTVGSCLSAVREATGEYVFLTSPGDYLFDEYVLRDFYRFAKEQDCPLSFGNAVFYCAENGVPRVTRTIGAPARPQLFAPEKAEKTGKLSFFAGDWIIGASYFRDRRVFLSCLEQLWQESRYTEDSPSTAFALAAGHRLCRYDRNMVFYEDGTGVSTGVSEKWQRLLHRDALRSFGKLKSLYPGDPFVDIAFLNLQEKSRFRRVLKKLLRHPVLMLRLAALKRSAPAELRCDEDALARLSALLKIK